MCIKFQVMTQFVFVILIATSVVVIIQVKSYGLKFIIMQDVVLPKQK